MSMTISAVSAMPTPCPACAPHELGRSARIRRLGQRQGVNVGVLDGKSAIVTGSARGIGRATAELLASQGAKVLINDLDGDAAEQSASEIAGETVVYAGDLTKENASDELVKTAVDAWGKLDIVV